jgi:hypothetical protein
MLDDQVWQKAAARAFCTRRDRLWFFTAVERPASILQGRLIRFGMQAKF